MVPKFGFDKTIDFIYWLFKAGSTEFSDHLSFMEPTKISSLFGTWARTVFPSRLLKRLLWFSRLLDFGEQANSI